MIRKSIHDIAGITTRDDTQTDINRRVRAEVWVQIGRGTWDATRRRAQRVTWAGNTSVNGSMHDIRKALG